METLQPPHAEEVWKEFLNGSPLYSGPWAPWFASEQCPNIHWEQFFHWFYAFQIYNKILVNWHICRNIFDENNAAIIVKIPCGYLSFTRITMTSLNELFMGRNFSLSMENFANGWTGHAYLRLAFLLRRGTQPHRRRVSRHHGGPGKGPPGKPMHHLKIVPGGLRGGLSCAPIMPRGWKTKWLEVAVGCRAEVLQCGSCAVTRVSGHMVAICSAVMIPNINFFFLDWKCYANMNNQKNCSHSCLYLSQTCYKIF